MTEVNVAIVSRDDSVRMSAARAFDSAPLEWRVRLYEHAPSDADVVVLGSDVTSADVPAERVIPFDPRTPAETIERIRALTATRLGRTFVVAGAGRGVGATTLALHLAAELSDDTCFLDLDLEWGAAARLGIDGEHRTWGGTEDVRSDALPVAGGFRVLLSPRTEVDLPPMEAVSVAAANFATVVADVPDPRLLAELEERATAIVLVAPFTVNGARRAGEILRRASAGAWLLVLNRLGPGGERTAAHLGREAGTRVVAVLPCSPSLRDAEDEDRLPEGPWSRYRRSVRRLAAVLHGLGDRA